MNTRATRHGHVTATRSLLLVGLLTGGCGSSSSNGPATPSGGAEPFLPDLSAASFSNPTTIDHPFFPLVPGTTTVFRSETEDGTEIITVDVTDEVKVVQGIDCVVVHDVVALDGDVIEDTDDWYAQDDDGNVWYMGEASEEIEDGVPVSSAGSWEAGLDVADVGSIARPGYAMPADPRVGDLYRQELYPGEAEDQAEVIATDATVTLADGRVFTGCLQTRDENPLDRESVAEFKYYAAGIGQVLETSVDGEQRVELQ